MEVPSAPVEAPYDDKIVGEICLRAFADKTIDLKTTGVFGQYPGLLDALEYYSRLPRRA